MSRNNQSIGRPRILIRVLVVTLVLLSLAVGEKPAQASLLNLEFQGSTGIDANFITVHFDGKSQQFSAKGYVTQFTNSASATVPIVNGSLSITATISSTGTFSSGSITVSGAVPSLGISQGVLFSGDLNSLGYSDPGGVVEFQFNTNGGALATYFNPIIGVVLGQSGFTVIFTNDFSSNSIAVASIGN